jgi:hypothetical protein
MGLVTINALSQHQQRSCKSLTAKRAALLVLDSPPPPRVTRVCA